MNAGKRADAGTNPIEIVYRETNEELEVKNHFHNSYEIIYILEGNVSLKVNGRVYEIDGNNIVFINNFESHELVARSNSYKRYYILIKPSCLHSIINEPIILSIFKHRPEHFRHVVALRECDANAVLGFFKNMRSEMDGGMDFMNEALISHLRLMLIYLYRNYREAFPLAALNKPMETILRIQKYLEDNYSEEITLEEVSRRFYINAFYLSHSFKKMTGFGFKEYLILQRISRAKDFLFHTPDDITRISLNVGFSNVNHFIRIFKKYEGLTPLQYRKNAGKPEKRLSSPPMP